MDQERTTESAGQPAITPRSALICLVMVLMWTGLICFMAIHETIYRYMFVMVLGFAAIMTVFLLKFPRFFLVAICAEKENRWKRVSRDYCGRQGEFDRDDRRDENEGLAWVQTVQKCVVDADFVYFNNEQHFVRVVDKEKANDVKIKRDLRKQADDFVPLMKGVPGAAAWIRHSIASTSQLHRIAIEIMLPGPVPPIKGMGMTAIGISHPISSR